MTVRSKQLGMIKRCGLADSAWIGQSVTQKVNQISLVLQCETQKINVGVHVLVFFTKRIEIAATVVELDHLFQGQLAAVVEIRGGQSHVAKLRRLEETAIGDLIIAVQRRHGDAVARASGNRS